VGLGILKQRNANMVDVGRRVVEKVEALQKTLPSGIQLAVNFDGTAFVKQSTHELNFNLILAAVLTSVICWLFLGSWSSAINIILAIPTSILGTFIVLQMLGFTQNTFTLLGLTLVVGIVVDDAIMVLENVVRHREMGELPRASRHRWGSRNLFRRHGHLRGHSGDLSSSGVHQGRYREILLPIRDDDLGGGHVVLTGSADVGPHALLSIFGGGARGRRFSHHGPIDGSPDAVVQGRPWSSVFATAGRL
jgi:hypothetical protein